MQEEFPHQSRPIRAEEEEEEEELIAPNQVRFPPPITQSSMEAARHKLLFF